MIAGDEPIGTQCHPGGQMSGVSYPQPVPARWAVANSAVVSPVTSGNGADAVFGEQMVDPRRAVARRP
jgi:hypothetical protein